MEGKEGQQALPVITTSNATTGGGGGTSGAGGKAPPPPVPRKAGALTIPSFEEVHGAAAGGRSPPTLLDFFSSRRKTNASSPSASSSSSSSSLSSRFTSSLVPATDGPPTSSAASSATSPSSTSTVTLASAAAVHVVATSSSSSSSGSVATTSVKSSRSTFSASSMLRQDPYALSSPTMLNALLAAHSPVAASASSSTAAATNTTSAGPSLVVPRSPAPPPSTPATSSEYPSARRSRPLLVSTRQRGNKLLKLLHHVRWEFSETVIADYVMGSQACALYLSIKYHLLHPEYIHTRMRQIAGKFNLSVILCIVDVEGSTQPLEELMLLCISMGFTLVCVWSLEEAARYMETYKAYENKGAKIIKEKIEADPYAVLSDCLTAIRGVNKTDVLTLSSTFGSLKGIIDASIEELSLCPGLGARKVKNLYDTFHAPLDPSKKKRKQAEAQIESFLNRKVRTKRKSSEDAAKASSSTATTSETKEDVPDERADEPATVSNSISLLQPAASRKGKEKVDDELIEVEDSLEGI